MPHPVLRVQLLGGFNLVYNNAPVIGVNPARLQSLLAYLILHADSPQSRQQIAFLLWPDTTESQARNNLRQFFFQLRKALPDPDRFLRANANTIYWKTDEEQVVDLHLFEQTLKQADASERRSDQIALRKTLEQAVSTYQGDLLPNCYDDWIAPERERLRQQCQNVCQKLMRVLEAQREYTAALQIGQQMLRLDPLDEGTYIALIRLHMLNEDHASALRVYQAAVETLQRELGVEPDEALRSAYERLQHAPRTISTFGEGDSSTSTSFTLVGRQPEWQTLQTAWKRAAAGNAQLALITGEAGIGKSRLAEELFNWVRRQGFTTAYTRSYAAEGSLSFAPVTEMLRSIAVRPNWNTLDKLWLTEISRLLPEILNEHPDLSHPEPISEYGQRQRFFEALARAVLAAPHPLLLWIDDLQWCDQETLEWLHFLLRFEPHNALLILGTARSEESPPEHPLSSLARQLQMEKKVAVIELSALDAAEMAKLASQVRGQAFDTTETVRLYRETEGNPLFVIETIRAGIADTVTSETMTPTAATSDGSYTLPPGVHAVILRRLSQLSPSARKVVEIGAAIGRAFPFDLLLRVGSEDEETVTHALDELWQRRVVRDEEANLFDFTHDKLREVAYMETSLPKRRLLHRQIAQALEVIKADVLDDTSAQLAAHFEQAGLYEQAIPYYLRAGMTATRVYANDDAINLLTRALELLTYLPPGEKRDTQELVLLLPLATLYRITKGWASSDLEHVANRMQALGDTVGTVAQRVQTLFLLQTVYIVAARFDQMLQTENELIRLLELADSPPSPFMKVNFIGATLQSTGNFKQAQEQFEGMIAARDDKSIRALQVSQGVNYLALGHVWKSHALWCLGYPQQALEGCEEGLRVALEFAHPFSQAMAGTYFALLQELRSDGASFRAQAEAAFEFAGEHKATYYHAWSNILVCFAKAQRQPYTDIQGRLRNAIRVFTETGARLRIPYYLSLLARVLYNAGQFDEGLNTVEDALAESQKNNEHWWDAELHRLRGELFWSQGANADEVEAAFLHSIEIAQAQQAKSLELRAATSLARLWQANSRSAEAKQLLIPVYEWFTEGFDTPDLQAAQALILQL